MMLPQVCFKLDPLERAAPLVTKVEDGWMIADLQHRASRSCVESTLLIIFESFRHQPTIKSGEDGKVMEMSVPVSEFLIEESSSRTDDSSNA